MTPLLTEAEQNARLRVSLLRKEIDAGLLSPLAEDTLILDAAIDRLLSARAVPVETVGWLISNSEGDDDYCNNPSALSQFHYKGGDPLPLIIRSAAEADKAGVVALLRQYIELESKWDHGRFFELGREARALIGKEPHNGK